MEYRVKQLLRSKLVPALLSVVLGILIIIARRAALDLLVKIIGALVIGSGIGFILLYLTRRDKEAGNLTMVLTLAAISALAGTLTIVLAEHIVDFFPMLVGVCLILNGLSHLTAAFTSLENRFLVALIGVLAIALGLLIVIQPGFLVNMILVFIGASLVVNGLMDLVVLKRIRGALLM